MSFLLKLIIITSLLSACSGGGGKEKLMSSAPDLEDFSLTNKLSVSLSFSCNETGELLTFTGLGLSPNPQIYKCLGTSLVHLDLSLAEGVETPIENPIKVLSLDAKGKPAKKSTSFNLPIDNLAPVVTITGNDIFAGQTVQFSISVSEAFLGTFTPILTTTGTTVGTLSGAPCSPSANPCVLTVNEAGHGSLTLSLPTGVINDLAGNPNRASFKVLKISTDCEESENLNPGDFCSGGAVYLGSLSPGALSGSGTDYYMTTPGGCTDSSTPTCAGGRDSLRKSFQGSTGGLEEDIPELTNINGFTAFDQNYGDHNTNIVAAHNSISSDSAADWCNDLVYGTYSDWYLPNKQELDLFYTNKNSISGLVIDVYSSFYLSSSLSFFNNKAYVVSRALKGGSRSDDDDFISYPYFFRCVRRF